MNSLPSEYLISVDIGTTHTKALLYRLGAGQVGLETEGYPTYYPRPGYVEQDPQEVLAAVLKAVRRLVENSRLPPQQVGALVFGGIWQSLLAVDRAGEALGRASTWADTRSLAQNERLKARLDGQAVRQRTGCGLHPMYFASRLVWLREEAPEVYQRAARFVSIKEFILGQLFGVNQVDHSTASGTGIWNMTSMDWDRELLAEIRLPANRFSQSIEPISVLNGGLRREYAAALGLLSGTPGVIGAADGAMAHLGSVGLSTQRLSLTVGTGAALRRRVPAPCTLPHNEAWCYYLADGNWLQGGVIPNAGNALRWFGDQCMGPGTAEDEAFEQMNGLAAAVSPGADGLLFIPMLGGERCPHDRPEARGLISGLSFSHGRGHMVRALMEGLAYILFSVYRMLDPELKSELVVTGGILKSPLWLKIVADFFGKRLWMPPQSEAAAWGGAILGLRALGALPDLEAAAAFTPLEDKQDPDPETHAVYRELLAHYDRLYGQIYGKAT